MQSLPGTSRKSLHATSRRPSSPDFSRSSRVFVLGMPEGDRLYAVQAGTGRGTAGRINDLGGFWPVH
jgi:hypothetical protein